jgi:hypothetical protein
MSAVAAAMVAPATVGRLALLPVDARPVVREQVVQLAATANIELFTPPIELLGHFRQPGSRDQLADWLREQAPQVEGFVVSLDMLIYGGLVPSRFIDDALDSLLARLAFIRELKHAFPTKPIYAFLATMRISNNNINDEEKPYWNLYGEAIWRWSFFSDQHALTGQSDAAAEAATAERLVPADIRDDYLATRRRNFAVANAVLGLVGKTGIDRLVLPQDDTARYGFNIAERRQLEATVAARQLQHRVLVYPGADEVAHTLLAHLATMLSHDTPLKLFVAYSDPANVEKLIARYEDRPITQSLAAQLASVDARVVDDPASADVFLAVHTQGPTQGDWAMNIPLPDAPGINSDWLAQIHAAHQTGKPIAIVDLAYANGADPQLILCLAQVMPLTELVSYAAWNTASNSIGSVLAQCRLARHNLRSVANRQVVCLRLVEDYLWQTHSRQKIRATVDEPTMSAQALEAAVAAQFIPAANQWLAQHQFAFRVDSIFLPWQRSFEIGVHLKPAAQ